MIVTPEEKVGSAESFTSRYWSVKINCMKLEAQFDTFLKR